MIRIGGFSLGGLDSVLVMQQSPICTRVKVEKGATEGDGKRGEKREKGKGKGKEKYINVYMTRGM